LFTAQDRKWIPVLLKWLTFHDRPAVQVESLLALTNIAHNNLIINTHKRSRVRLQQQHRPRLLL
jgi:hypothetical protein